MIRSTFFGLIVLLGILFGLAGCGEWKPLGHSVGKHSQHHHGSGAREHKEEHPDD